MVGGGWVGGLESEISDRLWQEPSLGQAKQYRVVVRVRAVEQQLCVQLSLSGQTSIFGD